MQATIWEVDKSICPCRASIDCMRWLQRAYFTTFDDKISINGIAYTQQFIASGVIGLSGRRLPIIADLVILQIVELKQIKKKGIFHQFRHSSFLLRRY